MIHIHVCPRCHQEVSEERRNSIPAVCDSCGFVLSGREGLAGQQEERRMFITVLAVSVALVLTFMQVVAWGSHSLEAIPLQVSHWLRISSPAQLERLVQISFELKKYDLTESAYVDLARVDHASYLRLAKFQMSRAKYQEASESFRRYFADNKVEDLDAHYLYARALGEVRQVDESSQHFEYVLRAKPGVRQVTVLQNYVKMLAQNGRLDRARKVIEHERTRDKTASMFMETEYKVILERLHSST
jgi:tetratricopeptide (TPR) repeat protein